MLPVERIIGEEGLTTGADGLRLAMRLPWYRSLPFSIYEVASLTIDGAAVDLADANVEYEGNSWPLAQLGDQTDAFWFVRDSAFLHLPSRQLEPGSVHEVALVVHISPPYIPGMKRTNPQTETLRVA
jgi:Domain of unknown function (DUF6379)